MVHIFVPLSRSTEFNLASSRALFIEKSDKLEARAGARARVIAARPG